MKTKFSLMSSEKGDLDELPTINTMYGSSEDIRKKLHRAVDMHIDFMEGKSMKEISEKYDEII